MLSLLAIQHTSHMPSIPHGEAKGEMIADPLRHPRQDIGFLEWLDVDADVVVKESIQPLSRTSAMARSAQRGLAGMNPSRFWRIVALTS